MLFIVIMNSLVLENTIFQRTARAVVEDPAIDMEGDMTLHVYGGGYDPPYLWSGRPQGPARHNTVTKIGA